MSLHLQIENARMVLESISKEFAEECAKRADDSCYPPASRLLAAAKQLGDLVRKRDRGSMARKAKP